jgi:methylenetetrahydrofolate reductase (NADPH)
LSRSQPVTASAAARARGSCYARLPGIPYRFVGRARRAGIQVPIVAGILPILSTRQVRRFTALCGSRIPAPLDRQLSTLADDDAAVRELGIEQATDQARRLWDDGVDGIHFYVLNRSHSVTRILENLGLPGHEAASDQGR